MKFVLELNKSEANAIKKANNKVKQVFSKIKNSFKVKIVDDENKSGRKNK